MGADIATFDDVSLGQKVEGTVKKVTLSGAIVDVGAPVDGLLHISELGKRGITRTSDLLSEGESITAWVKRIDESKKHLSLTLVEPAKYTWKDLQPGLKTEGKVVRLEKFGAFVDLQAETDGLVHISEMSTKRIASPSDVVSEGDVITVWVKEADRKTRRISLTMKEPPEVDMRALKPDMTLNGTVVRIESFGAFVDIGAERDGMVHVTEMSQGYVNSPSEIVSVGDSVEVRVLEVDPRRGRISLSMKDTEAQSFVIEDEEAEDIPTAMELALREAMENDGVPLPFKETPRRRRKKSKRRRRDDIQDDIISRTLRDHHD